MITTPEESYSPGDVQQRLSAAFKHARLQQNHSRKTAASLTGVPESTLKVFELSGQISLRQFLMVVQIYGKLEAVWHLVPEHSLEFTDTHMQNSDKKTRQRGRT